MLKILTPKEAAKQLRVTIPVLARMTRERKIPGCAKIGQEWRYTQEGINSIFLSMKSTPVDEEKKLK